MSGSGAKSDPEVTFKSTYKVDDVEDANLETLTSFVMRVSQDRELTVFMNALQLSFKFIIRAVRKAGIANLYGQANTTNSSGDDVKKLDLLSDEIMINALSKSGTCAMLVSEEKEEPIIMEPAMRGSLCCAIAPLDRSSNNACNVSTGTIFSVFKKTTPKDVAPQLSDILRPGTDMIAAGYCMYGAACDLVVTFMDGVHRFTLDDSLGEFMYMGESRRQPRSPHGCLPSVLPSACQIPPA
jgi:fructose-1,6-bisphosphatase I